MNPDASIGLEKASGFLSAPGHFLIFTHENPDGDAFGSVFSLHSFLTDNGGNATVLLPEGIPENYQSFAPENGITEKLSPEKLKEFDFVVCLDNSAKGRCGLESISLEAIKQPLLNIDHHPDNEKFGSEDVIVPDAASTTEILFRIFKKSPNRKISDSTATALLLGLMMDTGTFRFDNTSPAAFRTAGELLELGADHHRIIKSMHLSRPLNYLRFEAELLSDHLRTAFSDRFAWFFIPEEMISKYTVDLRDTEGLIDIIRSIAGTDIVALMQKREDYFKVSLRSKDPKYSAGKIARQLNGGGHEMAAGCKIFAPDLAEAEKVLLQFVKNELNQGKP